MNCVPAVINPKLATQFLGIKTACGLVDVYFQREYQFGDKDRINACILDTYSHRDNKARPFTLRGISYMVCEWFSCPPDKDFTLPDSWQWHGGNPIAAEIRRELLPLIPADIFHKEGPGLRQKILLSTMDELIAAAQNHVDWKMEEVTKAMQEVSDLKAEKNLLVL